MDLLTEQQAADLLGVGRSTLERWRYEGRGPAFHKLVRSVRYSRSDLEAFVASCRRQPQTAELCH